MADLIPDFIQIPKPVLIDKNLQVSDKFLFGYIYWFSRLRLKKCTASNQTLAELTGYTPRSIKNSLSRLKAAGYITISYSGDPHARATKRTIDSNVEYAKKTSLTSDTQKQRYVSLTSDTRVTGISPNKENKRINKKEGNSGYLKYKEMRSKLLAKGAKYA